MVLGSAGFARSLVQSAAFATAPKSGVKAHYLWVILYWMPYDNDLTHFGETIVDSLARGTSNSNIAVVVQSDYWSDPSMRRRWLAHESVYEMDVTGEDSSNVSAFSEYLNWAHQTFEADHWAVIVVGHGGKINEISPDDHGVTETPRTWMRVDQFAKAVSHFNRSTNGRVELLFFQNCNKATLEVIYEVRNSARYTLASQMELGAPNDYYQGFFNRLTKNLVDGREAAIAIVESERDDMYHTLTLVDNKSVEALPDQLSQLIRAILNSSQIPLAQADLVTYSYFDEQHCDALNFFATLAKSSAQAQAEFIEFAKFVNSSMIVHHQKGGQLYRRHSQDPRLTRLNGLGLYLPETKKAIDRYQALEIYQKSNLLEAFERIITN